MINRVRQVRREIDGSRTTREVGSGNSPDSGLRSTLLCVQVTLIRAGVVSCSAPGSLWVLRLSLGD